MIRAAIAIALALILSTCTRMPTLVEQIQALGELRVVMRESPVVVYQGADGLTGFEYELVEKFADELGVEVRVIMPDDFNQTLSMVREGQAHMAAAGLSITESRRAQVAFSPAIQEISPQVVYHASNGRPRSWTDIPEGALEVIAHTSHVEHLRKISERVPQLQWQEHENVTSHELLYRVSRGQVDYTVADSNEVLLTRRYYPQIRIAFTLDDVDEIGWAMRHSYDASLQEATADFIRRTREDGRLAKLEERHYGHAGQLNQFDGRNFFAHIKQRLPQYMDIYHEAAEEVGLDWRLLAAIGYQESLWDPDAVSPTGVRGIMMLTLRTASELGVNRLDPEQSIRGGARYMRNMKSLLPDSIQEPDRTWMALAAYNVGLGHLEDARKITRDQDGNPDLWMDVRERLPLLSDPDWYRQTRYGRARGNEPVVYVENIRGFHDILVWVTDNMNGDDEDESYHQMISLLSRQTP